MAGSLRVLFYHRIGDPLDEHADLAPEIIAATPAMFDRQLRHLGRAYHPIGAPELLAALDERHTLPPRAVLVTFDDAYRDFGDIAWPLLKQHHIPSVLFVSTAYADDPWRLFWWDEVWQVLARTDQHCVVLPNGVSAPLGSFGDRRTAWKTLTRWLKSLPPGPRARALRELSNSLGVRPRSTRSVLSWAELRQLATDGVAIGGHSRTHEFLDQLDAQALAGEVTGCRDDLVRELGHAPPLFAYPNGNFNRATRHAMVRARYRVGFTTLPGLNLDWTSDPYAVRREGCRTSLLRFAVKLIGPVAKRRATRARPALDVG